MTSPAFTDVIFGGAGSYFTGNVSEIDLNNRWSADRDVTVNGGIHDDTLRLLTGDISDYSYHFYSNGGGSSIDSVDITHTASEYTLRFIDGDFVGVPDPNSPGNSTLNLGLDHLANIAPSLGAQVTLADGVSINVPMVEANQNLGLSIPSRALLSNST